MPLVFLAGIGPSAHPWTDDRSPVEWITDAMIVDHVARGR